MTAHQHVYCTFSIEVADSKVLFIMLQFNLRQRFSRPNRYVYNHLKVMMTASTDCVPDHSKLAISLLVLNWYLFFRIYFLVHMPLSFLISPISIKF